VAKAYMKSYNIRHAGYEIRNSKGDPIEV